MQGLLGVLPVSLDHSHAMQPIAHRPDEERGVRKREHRAVEAELVIEGGCEHEHIGGEHPSGVVRHEQRAARRRNGLEPAYLRPEIALDDGADPLLDLLGECGIPLGGLFAADGVNVFVAHSFPYVLLFATHTHSGRRVPTSGLPANMILSLTENVISIQRGTE